jgi:hypothetical protein
VKCDFLVQVALKGTALADLQSPLHQPSMTRAIANTSRFQFVGCAARFFRPAAVSLQYFARLLLSLFLPLHAAAAAESLRILAVSRSTIVSGKFRQVCLNGRFKLANVR